MNTEAKNTDQTDLCLEAGAAILHKSTLFSSLWEESTETRIVWITLLLMADADGSVHESNEEIAQKSRISEVAVRDAINRLSKPDPASRNRLHDGRRLLLLEDCVRIVNYRLYNHEAMAKERLKERNRVAQAAFRERLVANGDTTLSSGFDEFWKLYPRKLAKKHALIAYNKALQRASHAEIMEGLNRAVPFWLSRGEMEFVPHATTFLNGDRWQDEYEVPVKKADSRQDFFALNKQKEALEAEMRRHPGNRDAIGYAQKPEDVKAYVALKGRVADINRRISEIKL